MTGLPQWRNDWGLLIRHHFEWQGYLNGGMIGDYLLPIILSDRVTSTEEWLEITYYPSFWATGLPQWRNDWRLLITHHFEWQGYLNGGMIGDYLLPIILSDRVTSMEEWLEITYYPSFWATGLPQWRNDWRLLITHHFEWQGYLRVSSWLMDCRYIHCTKVRRYTSLSRSEDLPNWSIKLCLASCSSPWGGGGVKHVQHAIIYLWIVNTSLTSL